MRFRFTDKGRSINGVAFGMADHLSLVKDGQVDLVFKITKNYFRGRSDWEVRAEDIKVGSK